MKWPRKAKEETLRSLVELKGMKKALYASAGKRFPQGPGSEIFNTLLDAEKTHLEALEKNLKKILDGEDHDINEGHDLKTLISDFRPLLAAIDAKPELLPETLIFLENATGIGNIVIYFCVINLKKAEYAREREFLNRMLAIERGHLGLLTSLKHLLVAPENRAAPGSQHGQAAPRQPHGRQEASS